MRARVTVLRNKEQGQVISKEKKNYKLKLIMERLGCQPSWQTQGRC